MSDMPALAVLIGLYGAVLFGFTVIVVVRYWWGWRKIVKRGMEHRHLLPLHVWVIALSYDLFLIGAIIQMSVVMRWWHPFLYLPAISLGVLAMLVIIRVGRLREMPEPPD